MSDAVAAPAAVAAPVAAEAPAAAPAAPAVDAAKELEARLGKLQHERDLKVREVVVTRRQYETQLKQAQQRIAQLEQLEKAQQTAKINPVAYAREAWGDNWYDVLTEAKLNGVPPADLIAAEMGRMREEFAGELSRRDAEAQRQARVAAQRAQEQQLRAGMADVQGGFREFFEARGDNYPALAERYGGDSQAISRALFQHAKQVWDASVQYDEAGNMVRPGQVLDPKSAAEALEKRERDLVAKIQGRLTPTPNNAPIGGPRLQSQSSQQQQQQTRRTLSNALTASTPGMKPANTQADKRARAISAFNAARGIKP